MNDTLLEELDRIEVDLAGSESISSPEYVRLMNKAIELIEQAALPDQGLEELVNRYSRSLAAPFPRAIAYLLSKRADRAY